MRSAVHAARERPFRLRFLWMTIATLMGTFSCSSNDGGPTSTGGSTPSAGGTGGAATTGGGGATGGSGPMGGASPIGQDTGTPQPAGDSGREGSADPLDAGTDAGGRNEPPRGRRAERRPVTGAAA